ncbi:hypothetical protein G6514_005980 [Epicoccum nigrum]|nr:hypothetical protein G6514_005980 [Epicoccum nigrum]
MLNATEQQPHPISTDSLYHPPTQHTALIMADFLPADMTLPSWFEARIAPNGDVEDNEGGCHPSEATALQDYLSPYISPSPSPSPSNPNLNLNLNPHPTPAEAARAMTSFIASQPDPEDHLHHLWGLLQDALADAPSSALDALIELLAAIEDLDDPPALSPPPATSNAASGDAAAPRFWKGLPQFGNLWADTYPSWAWRGFVSGSAGPRREELLATHIRRAEVEARLVRAGLGGLTLGWGYEAVADALERGDAVRAFEVPAAAAWVVLCAGLFKRGAESGERSWGLRAKRERDLWRGEGEEMSLERWAFWGGRLRALQEDGGEVREVRAALEAMGEV